MKALSVTQPWATLIATGQKQIETRSWGTRYRGPLYIHAAKRFPAYAKTFALEVYGNPVGLPTLPLGAIVAMAYLSDVRPTEEMLPVVTALEAKYGDFSPGRYAWILTNLVQIEPFPCKGALGLFEIAAGALLDGREWREFPDAN